MAKLNKLTKGLFVLSALALLAGCDQLKNIPANYEDKIVNVDNLQDNYMGVIYDAINGNVTDKVHDDIIQMIGEKEYGTYEQIMALKDADDSVLLPYAHAHAHAFIKESDTALADHGETVNSVRIKRVKAFYNDVMDRIYEIFHKEINGGSYNDKESKFHELKFAMAKFNDMYKFEDSYKNNIKVYDNDAAEKENWYIGYLDSDFKKETVVNYLNNGLAPYADYIKRSVFPQIYKDKIVEDYIVENNKSNLGRAYGRKIEFVKVTADSGKEIVAYNLAKAFAIAIKKNPDITFEDLATAYRGFEGISYDSTTEKLAFNALTIHSKSRGVYSVAEKLAEEAYADVDEYVAGEDNPNIIKVTLPETSFTNENPIEVYRYTKVGQIFYDYNLALKGNENGRFAKEDEKSAYNSFTSNGTQSIEKGLRDKIIDLAVNGDYTEDGWFVKNGSVNLPDDAKTRLFNINVSYALSYKEEQAGANYEKYVSRINNNVYLTGSTSLDVNYPYMINDGNSYYFVKIEEAPSTIRLDMDRDTSYFKVDTDNVMKTEEIYRELANIITTKSSYSTKAYQALLEKYEIMFHDEEVYEYFKSKYPDLYDEDDD